MKKSKVISLGVCAAILASSTVFAAATYRTFTATERPDFKIVMDGEVQKFKDGNGNPIHPVIINGSTYLPLKATANLFGKNVAWDSVTGTATLGDKVASEYSILDVSTIGNKTTRAFAVKGEASLTFDIGDVGMSYDSAIQLTGSTDYMTLGLNESYSNLNLTLYSPDVEARFIITDADTGIDVLNKTLNRGEIIELKEIDIKNVKKLKFSMTGITRNNNLAGYFLNPIVK